jgi:hypothetical protein
MLGKKKTPWQDTEYVLGQFGREGATARKRYRDYVKEGIEKGRRPELVGGGLIRSLGGWRAIEGVRKENTRLKGDERILGESGFVLEALREAEERFDRRERLRGKGYDLKKLARKAAKLFGVAPEGIFSGTKTPKEVQARSVFCYWAVRELGMSATEVAKQLGLTQPAVSISVRRGEKIAEDEGISF